MIERALGSAIDLSSVEEAVYAASRRARAEFGVAGHDFPVFSVLIALIDETRVDLAWVGDVNAWLEHDGKIVQSIVPHVFVKDNARVVTRPLPGDPAWERDPFLERATWVRSAGDIFGYE
jgi:hypothetical protein